MRELERATIPRTVLGAAILSATIGLTACGGTPDGGDDFAAERKTVDAFMTALENGNAQQASTYLADRASFPAVALTDEFYASAAGRPQDARIAVATESQGVVYIQVDYRLGSDDRELDLVVEGGDDPRIAGWSGVPTILRASAADGSVSVSDALTIEVGSAASYISLLPGRYSVSFTGGDAAIEPFDLDFPVGAPGTDTQLPAGVSFVGGVLDFGR